VGEKSMKWTFGISLSQLTYLDRMIKSIVNQEGLNNKNFEILLVGEVTDSLLNLLEPYCSSGVEIKVFAFDESEKSKWITKKKNIISKLASYENICYLHDYISLCKKWYLNFIEFGDNWDVSMNCVRNLDGSRFRDWILSTAWYGGPKAISYDDHKQTNRMYISGSYWCAKKTFMLENPLDENRSWGQGEDVEWSFRCRTKWNYRMNKNSGVRLLKIKSWNGVVDTGIDPSEDPDINIPINIFEFQT
jgi:hypothetical protein